MDKVWQARWVWVNEEKNPKNTYGYFRKGFELADLPREAKINISADSRYILYINGQYINRGPTRSDRRFQYYDRWEITKYLKQGKNVMTALVHHYGETTFQYMLGRAAFLAELEITGKDGLKIIGTDKSWKAMVSPCWYQDIPRLAGQLGFYEIYTAEKEPLGWREVDFDDTNWQNCLEVGQPPCPPWDTMQVRDIPPMIEKEIWPVKIIKSGNLDRSYHQIDFLKYFSYQEWVTAYALTYVYSPKKQKVEIRAGSDDGIKIWLNKQIVISTDVYRAAEPDQEKAGVVLKKGWNEVLLKITQGGGAWKFYFRIVDEHKLGLRISAKPEECPKVWQVIGPFDNTDKKGFDTVFAPEQEIAWDKEYSGKNNQKIKWQMDRSKSPADDTDIAELMQGEYYRPLETGKISRVNSLTRELVNPLTTIQTQGRDIFVVLDFGKEVTGFPKLVIDKAEGGEIIDIGYSELLENGKVVPNRGLLHYADRYICRRGPQVFQTFDKRAFRYMQLTFRNCLKPLKIKSLSLIFSTYPVEYRGSFKCSDKLLNKIWDIGAYTLQLNMEDAYTDCPWRERGQWWGDARLEILFNYYAFGDGLLAKRGIRQIGQSQREDGITAGMYPSDWKDGDLADYSLIWIMSIWDYYTYTGERELLDELYPKIVKVLGWFEKFLDEDGLLNKVPGWVFIDWADIRREGEGCALNSYYYNTLNLAAQMAEMQGDSKNAKKFRKIAAGVKVGLNQHHWDEEKGVFLDNFLDGKRGEVVSQQANSLAVLYGIGSEENCRRAIKYVMNKKNKVVETGSPYFSYYLLSAMYRLGFTEMAFDYVRQRWGMMVKAGATTFWELWNPQNSLCHAWSSGPVYFLGAETLGVKPAEPGYKTVKIQPYPEDLKWAKGVVPIVGGGEIKAEWKKQKSSFELRFDSPATTLVYLPKLSRKVKEVRVNGKKTLPVGVERLSEDKEWSVFKCPQGKYNFKTKG